MPPYGASPHQCSAHAPSQTARPLGLLCSLGCMAWPADGRKVAGVIRASFKLRHNVVDLCGHRRAAHLEARLAQPTVTQQDAQASLLPAVAIAPAGAAGRVLCGPSWRLHGAAAGAQHRLQHGQSAHRTPRGWAVPSALFGRGGALHPERRGQESEKPARWRACVFLLGALLPTARF